MHVVRTQTYARYFQRKTDEDWFGFDFHDVSRSPAKQIDEATFPASKWAPGVLALFVEFHFVSDSACTRNSISRTAP